MSNVVTQGIRISVESFYLPAKSQPERGQYIFAYTVRITNEGDAPAQLISRHWIIQDAYGRAEHVRGPGVVGAQPRLEPGQSHEYTSFCPLGTPSGSMQGTYQMVRDDGDQFDAAIGVFSLMAPQLLN
ncbi:MAG: Co2+/Mg2+ efflux protein ApaG [Candidatus Tectomicrobia bacterium]|jgi:ApaG protein